MGVWWFDTESLVHEINAIVGKLIDEKIKDFNEEIGNIVGEILGIVNEVINRIVLYGGIGLGSVILTQIIIGVVIYRKLRLLKN